jgi:Tat protein secretion system quality control protein TatD with DNase activity
MAPGAGVVVDPLTGLRIDDDDDDARAGRGGRVEAPSKPKPRRRRKQEQHPPTSARGADDPPGTDPGLVVPDADADADAASAPAAPRRRSVDAADDAAGGRRAPPPGSRRKARHRAPRPGEIGFEGLDDGGRGQSLFSGMSRAAAKKKLEREARAKAPPPAARPAYPDLDGAPIVDLCAHAHLLAAATGRSRGPAGSSSSAAAVSESPGGSPPPRVEAIVHAVCDAETLDPAYGSALYRAWERSGPSGDGDDEGASSSASRPSTLRAFGLSPSTAAAADADATLRRLARYVRETRAVAVGVVGLDYDAAGGDDDAKAAQRAFLEGATRLARGEIDVDVEPDASATGATTRSSVAADDDDDTAGPSIASGSGSAATEKYRAPSPARPLVLLLRAAGGAEADAHLVAAYGAHRASCLSAGATRAPAAFLSPSPNLLGLVLGGARSFPAADCVVALSCAVTHAKCAALREVAFDVPMDRVALASECPRFAPSVSLGGGDERSTPAALAHAAAKIAEIKGRGVTPGDVARAAAENARRVLGRGGGV